MGYPRVEKDRVLFWTNMITHTRQRIKPLFDACQVLEDQYFNRSTTDRERHVGDSNVEEHVRRTKAGIVYGWIDQSLANLLDRDPILRMQPENRIAAQRINPDDPNSLSRAKGNSKIINYRYRETGQLRVDERVAQDAYIYPYGVAKIGMHLDDVARGQQIIQPDAELEFDDPEEETLFLQVGQRTRVTEHQDHLHHIQVHKAFINEVLRAAEAQTGVDQLIEFIEEHIAWHEEYLHAKAPDVNTKVKRESPYGIRWQPDLFLTDELCVEGPPDARWVAFGWELPIDEVRAIPGYSNVNSL